MLYFPGILQKEGCIICFLSVIIPVYNAAPYLDECLGSILSALPGGADVQLLLVDDGSTDGSAALCDGYAAMYPDLIQTVHQPHRGVAAARNTGLRLARGAYIAWVDPDDSVATNWYNAIHAALMHHRPDLLVMDILRFGPEGEAPERYGRAEGPVDPDCFARDVYRDIRMLSGLPNKVFRADILSGLAFDEALPILEDYAAMPEILRKVRSVHYLPRLLYRYRQHSGSLLHRNGPDMAWQSFQVSLRRADTVPRKYRNAARTGAAIQAYRCCIHSPDRQMACIRYVRRCLPGILADAEVPLKWKVKFLLLCLGIFQSKTR